MHQYIHTDTEGNQISFPLGKVVCVGRNYLKHIEELGNKVPEQPILFIKPATALTPLAEPIRLPKGMGECHNELEIAVLIGTQLSGHCDTREIETAIWGFGLGLDLTLRDIQSALKAQGHPWERAKSFDASCPMSNFVPKSRIENYSNLSFNLSVNHNLRQQGNTQNMLLPIIDLITEIAKSFTLLPGDIVMTGTPEGVAPLLPADQLEVTFDGHFSVTTRVV